MIEFKGAFYKNKTSPPQPVLVQFDGVLLHIWNISYPFHRILSSDDFEFPVALRQHRPCVKIPKGSRIETDNIQALNQLKSNCHIDLTSRIHQWIKRWQGTIVLLALAAALIVGFLTYWLFVE
jgi:hypothetical protein